MRSELEDATVPVRHQALAEQPTKVDEQFVRLAAVPAAKRNLNPLAVDRNEMLNITKVSSLFARENAGSITIKVEEADKSVSIHSVASQLGENTASTTGEISGSGTITLNSRYLLEALQVFDSEKVNLCFNGKLEASVLQEPDNDDYIHLIMPLKS